MSTIAVGMIKFCRVLDLNEYSDISKFILHKALANNIGINLQYNVSAHVKKRYAINFTSSGFGSCMAYELTEAPWHSQSDGLFNGIQYYDNNSCAGIDREVSKIVNIQKFFVDIMETELIKRITFELWEGTPIENSQITTIAPDMFIDTLENAYRNTTATDSTLTPCVTIQIR